MRVHKPGKTIAVAVITLGFIGVAAAQPGDTPEPPAPPVAEARTTQEVSLSPQQQQAEGEKYLKRMDQVAVNVRRMLEEARAARDVVKVLCLNDKLNQIDVANRSARDRMDSLRGAVSRNDADRARHEFTVMQVLRDRIEALVAEAQQCIGEETGFVGDTEVSVDIDPNIPDVDPDQLGIDPEVIIETPVLSSPIQ